MGLLDFASRVLTTYKADTSDHKAKIKELTGAEKKLAQEQLAGVEAHNRGIKSSVENIGKLAVAVAAAAGVMKLAWSGFQLQLEHTRLTTASAGVNIDKLRSASHGLKTEIDLLKDAALLNHGAFKLSSDQMATVERAMVSLTRKGFDSADVHSKIMKAVIELKDDGLKGLGIGLDLSAQKMDTAQGRADAFRHIMVALQKEAEGAGNAQATAGEKTQAAGVRLADAVARLKRSFGDLLSVLAPVVDLLARFVDLVAGRVMSTAELKAAMEAKRVGADPEKIAKAIAASQDVAQTAAAMAAQYPRGGFEIEMTGTDVAAEKKAAEAAAEKLRKYREETYQKVMEGLDEYRERQLAKLRGTVVSGGFGERAGGMEGIITTEGGQDVTSQALTDIANQRATEAWKSRLENLQAQGPGFLEKMFGPKGEFDVYNQLFLNLTSSMQGAYSGLVDGTLSAGEAGKQVIRSVLKGLGTQMLGHSIMELGKGFAALANPFTAPTAALHFKSAAVFAGGAVLMGVAASQIGGGGGGGGGSGGGGYSPGAPSSYQPRYGGEAPGHQGIVVIGNSFAHDSPRARQRWADDLVKQALSTTAGVYS